MKHNFFQIFLFYAFLTIVFFSTGIIILGYSLGYRYDYTKKQIVETSILRLSPVKEECQVFIDNNPIIQKKRQITIEITNLIPNKYRVTINCPQSQTWEKNISLQPGLVHNENNILILPNQPSEQEIAFINQTTSYNHNLAYVNTGKIYTINNDNGQTRFFSTTTVDAKTSQIKWLNDNNLIILDNSGNQQTDIQLLNIYNGNITKISLDQAINSDQVIGIDNLNNESLFIYLNQNIYTLDSTNQNPNLKPFLTNIYHPVVQNNHLFYQLEDNSPEIISLNLIFKYSTKIILDQPCSSFFVIPQKYWIIYNNNNKSYLFDINSRTSKLLNASAEKYLVSPDQQNVLIYNQQEIIIINNQKETNTLLRLSTSIDSLIWQNNTNILYSTDQTIKRIDINGENNQTLISNQNILSYQITNTFPNKILVIEKRPDQDLLKYLFLNSSNSPTLPPQ